MLGCEVPIRITETYTTDSSGKVTKTITKYYDSTHHDYSTPMYFQPYPYWQRPYYNPIYVMPRPIYHYVPKRRN